MKDVIWAMGGKRSKDLAHIYLSEEDYENGICLCGRHVTPYLRFPIWDLTNKDIKKHTCASCYQRLNLLKFLDMKTEEENDS